MKMRIFTLLLTAMLTMGMQAQDFADYSTYVGQSYNQLSRQFTDLEELFEGYYACAPADGKTQMLMIGFNSDLESHTIMQTLREGAYTLEQVIAYMDSKYTKYDPEVSESTDEETGQTVTMTTYSYGNTPDADDATLLIAFADEMSIVYTNPKLAPQAVETEGIGEMSPIDVVDTFIGKSLADIEDEHPGVFADLFGLGIYSTMASDDNEWLEGAALLLDDAQVATSIRLLFALEDAEVIAYYTANGYTCTENGTGDEGETLYTITNGTYTISYGGGTGDVTRTGGTGIRSVWQGDDSRAWYTIGGSRLSGKPAQKGLYIHGDRKVIIK